MRLERILAGLAQRHPGREALVCGERRLDYATLLDSVQRIAAGLCKLGIRPGDRVLLCLPNGVEFVQLAYAAFAAGATVVPVNTRLTETEIETIAADASPVLAVCDTIRGAALRHALRAVPSCHLLTIGGTDGDLAFDELLSASYTEASGVSLPEIPLERDECMILYTSGTTGRPKGAVNTHANMIVQNVFIHAREWGIGANDRFLVVTPIAHRAGCARMINAIGLGGTLVIMEKFDPAQAVLLIEQERVTVAGLVPTVIRMMLPHLRERPGACDSLRRVIVSTEAFPASLRNEIMALLPQARFYSVFGLSEALVTSLGHEEQSTHPASVGRPIPGIEVKLVDDAGHEVAPGETGELLVRDGLPGSGAVMKGYFNRPDETAAAIRGGWFHTGDMARCDADGYLAIVDRKKDMVLSGGYNVYSKEVEDVLYGHPAVAGVAVIGVPDILYGEAVAAFIELKVGERVTSEQLIEHCRTQLAGYKKPKHVFIVGQLPRNSLGKVLKNDLRKSAAEMLNAA